MDIGLNSASDVFIVYLQLFIRWVALEGTMCYRFNIVPSREISATVMPIVLDKLSWCASAHYGN